jgi:uncharacterized protein (DUF342 family)
LPSGKSPALSYNSQHHVVRMELSRSMALESSKPPADLIERARTRLEKVQNDGKIEFFEIYEDKLESIWFALRDAEDAADDLKISFVFAAGSPVIEGLSVINSDIDKPGVLISTSGPIDTKKISMEWIRARILKVAREHFIHETLFLPQVNSALLRIAAGDTLDKFLIESRSETANFGGKDKPFSVFANKARAEAIAYIHDLAAMQSDPAIERLCSLVAKAVDKLQSAGSIDLIVLKNEMTAVIRAAGSGPERIGLGMPLAVLAAMPDLSKTLGKKFLNFGVSDDKMTAFVTEFDSEVYEDAEFQITKEFIQNQIRKSDLKGQVPDKELAELIDAARKRENLDGKVAARGLDPSVGADPYIHLVYKDAPKVSLDSDMINIRDMQQRSIVQAGQLVAEIRYLKPEVIGMNVLGQPIQPEPGPAMEVVVGEGIQQLQPGKFFAECGGVPQCEEGNKLSLIKSHIHEGDVNLKSGNIYFDGPVEIKGSVDSGALVRVKGPVKIYGSITGGTVISKDPIEVVESIVTGTQGKVICATQIKAAFIENSTIECDGSIVVAKSLVSSDVVAGDYIHALAADGVIGGGTILCRNMVAAANIGFTKGARTKFIVGVDHRVVRRTKIREKRLQNLIEAQERYKLEFRELTQKKDGQLTLKHKQLKESLKEKMTNVRPLIETVTQQLESLKTSMTYNEDALIAATNVFAANCQVEVGGQGVVLEADTMAVGISARKRRDSHLCTYDEIKSEIEKRLAGSPVSEVPAPAVQAAAVQAAAVPSETTQQPAPAPETGAQAEVAPTPNQTVEATSAGDAESPAQATAEPSQKASAAETDAASVNETASQVTAEQTEEADPVVQESAPKAS